jgi:putative transposase
MSIFVAYDCVGGLSWYNQVVSDASSPRCEDFRLMRRASVHAADIHDATGGEFPLADLGDLAERLAHIWVDAGYRGLVAWAKADYGLELEVVTKEPGQQGFAIQPRRWVVERTIAWFSRNRRLSRDYEYQTECSEAFL